MVELLGVVVILGILITIGAVAVTSAINSANHTKVKADFKEFETAIKYILTDSPQLAKKTGYQNVDVLRTYNEFVEAELRIDLEHSGNEAALYEGGSNIIALNGLNQGSIVATNYIDPWGTPYKLYVQAENLGLTGNNGPGSDSPDAELRVFVISNGPNISGGAASNILDTDDICMMIEYVNGSIRTGFYNTDSTELTEICWFPNDIQGFDEGRVLDTSNPDTKLNMNLACTRPVAINEK